MEVSHTFFILMQRNIHIILIIFDFNLWFRFSECYICTIHLYIANECKSKTKKCIN